MADTWQNIKKGFYRRFIAHQNNLKNMDENTTMTKKKEPLKWGRYDSITFSPESFNQPETNDDLYEKDEEELRELVISLREAVETLVGEIENQKTSHNIEIGRMKAGYASRIRGYERRIGKLKACVNEPLRNP